LILRNSDAAVSAFAAGPWRASAGAIAGAVEFGAHF